MRRSTHRRLSATLVAALFAALAGPGAAAAAAPALTVRLSPALPDGSSGWYRTASEAFALSDEAATVHYDWGAGEATRAVTAHSAASLGFATEGTATLSAYAVNGDGESSPVTTLTIRTDTVPPAQPAAFAAVPSSGHISLTWADVTDETSGIGSYIVYRNLSGAPFSVTDAIASVTTTSYPDDPGTGTWYYAVQAVDRAGNDSLMSAAIRTSADVTPPTVPADVQAWRNGRGFLRVSWAPSRDTGSGVASYAVSRSIGGAAQILLATVPAGATFMDDADPEAYAADDVVYTVTAEDRAQNASAESTPAEAGTDLTPPSKPERPAVIPVPDLGGMFDHLGTDVQVTWKSACDADSGVLRYELAYGSYPDDPSTTLYFPRAASTFVRSGAERSDWFFSVRAEDRAGNVSGMSDATEQRAITVDRAAGSDRIRTSLAVARAAFASSHTAVFASAYSFPDALAASGLAGALHAPIVLVGPGPLPSDTRAALADLGVADGWVIGGPPAVAADTFASIDAALSGETTRVAGADRYRTASSVASAVVALAGRPARVYLVSGVTFPDALSVAPAAYAGACPVLFATPLGLPQATSVSLAAIAATGTVIVGGTSAVWSGAEAHIPAPTRVYGPDRYATSLAFARWAVGRSVLSADRPVLVTGATYPDGLSAGPLAGERRSPSLLVRGSDLGVAADFLGEHPAEVRRVTAVGSDIVIDYGVMHDAWKMFTLQG